MSGPFFFIVNPHAVGGRTVRCWQTLRDALDRRGVEYRFKFTSGPRSATILARQTPQGFTPVAVGGDGTLHECVAGLSEGVAIGTIPTGNSNDMARTLGISTSPQHALDQLLSSHVRPIDLPFVNGTPYLGMLGIGHGIDMAQSTQRVAKRISILDLIAIFRALPRIRTPELTVEVDGRRSSGRVFLLAVGNGRFFSGGLDLCPRAHCDDGLLDICIAGDLRRTEAVMALTRFFRGTHIHCRKFHYTKAHTISVDGPADVPLLADGSPVGTLPITVTLRQRALNVLVPDGPWNVSKVTSIRSRRPEWQKEEVSW